VTVTEGARESHKDVAVGDCDYDCDCDCNGDCENE